MLGEGGYHCDGVGFAKLKRQRGSAMEQLLQPTRANRQELARQSKEKRPDNRRGGEGIKVHVRQVKRKKGLSKRADAQPRREGEERDGR